MKFVIHTVVTRRIVCELEAEDLETAIATVHPASGVRDEVKILNETVTREAEIRDSRSRLLKKVYFT